MARSKGSLRRTLGKRWGARASGEDAVVQQTGVEELPLECWLRTRDVVEWASGVRNGSALCQGRCWLGDGRWHGCGDGHRSEMPSPARQREQQRCLGISVSSGAPGRALQHNYQGERIDRDACTSKLDWAIGGAPPGALCCSRMMTLTYSRLALSPRQI